jgi:hypothetical protein
VDEAQAWLEEVRSLAERDPKGAMRLVERRSAAFREAFALEGPLHGEFRTAVSALRQRLDPRRVPALDISVRVVVWESLTDLQSLVDAAGRIEADILYLGPSDRRREAAPLTQVDALNEFSDPKVMMVVVGEGPPMLFRTSFLQTASVSLNPRTDIADAGQDFLDLAGRSGYTTRWIR